MKGAKGALGLVGIALAVCGLAACANADREKNGSPATTSRAGSMVRIASGTDTVAAYLARPAAPPTAAVVVIQEWWGLNDWVKKVADRLAAQGYLAIAPDLYRGQVATDADLAHELMRGLPDERAVRDLRAASDFVRGLPEMRGLKVGVIGFCMGGRLSLLASLDNGPFDATVVAYGSPVTDAARLKTVRGPVLGIFGGTDRGIGPEQTGGLEKGLRDAGKNGEVIVYPNAGHAFLNDTGSNFRADAAKQAWERIDDFLARSLRKEVTPRRKERSG